MKLNLKINLSAANKVEKEILNKTFNDKICYDERKNECNLIYDNIFLSNYKTASNRDFLVNNDITHILNSAVKSNNYTPIFFDDFNYLKLNIKDEPGYDLIAVFYKCIEFLETCQKNNTKVLIHCYEVKYII